jgi:hypothetical protein
VVAENSEPNEELFRTLFPDADDKVILDALSEDLSGEDFLRRMLKDA